MTTVQVSGNTYPVTEQIQALGGRWNADARAWMVPEDKADQARALVASAPVSQSHHANNGRRQYTCSDCGDRVWTGTSCWETGLTH